MSIEILTPAMGESISEATVAKWMVAEGDFVTADQMVAELETDKVNLEVTAPSAGKITKISVAAGGTVTVGQVMAILDETAEGAPAASAEAAPAAPAKEEPKAAAPAAVALSPVAGAAEKSGPAVGKMVREGADVTGVAGSGKDGRLTKGDVLTGAKAAGTGLAAGAASSGEERVPMSRIRKTIASRLKQAQNTAAMLTTYNEVDLSAIASLRSKYQDAFVKKYGVKLGYMSFFSKAVVEALQAWPALNAEIDGEELVYKHHYDIGIAVASERGLVVPVVRGVDAMDLATIEQTIGDFGKRAKEGGLKPDELVGATFSITNGGVFGSLMSMPILNFPQVGILGMHAIKDRVVVVEEGGVKTMAIRPMMYLALTYDHRIVDGREAVSFLVRVKETLENPGRLLLGV
ncbi:MAG: dihydrolipoyllysine-residue succinyltransferase [Alphaproteobacteria bacterium CG_4_10_14_0_8_um_filter_53_9]|nr:MAG: dihydrolipoyllysine-residue succinyltransferase [Alphaproteobacteria bacterium CG_4_10_14_0_8_um_filter_53_9]